MEVLQKFEKMLGPVQETSETPRKSKESTHRQNGKPASLKSHQQKEKTGENSNSTTKKPHSSSSNNQCSANRSVSKRSQILKNSQLDYFLLQNPALL